MIRLKVSFREKDEAKQYGARWNAAEKIWYYPGEVLPEELERFLPAAPVLPESGRDLQRRAPAGETDTRTENALVYPDWLKDYRTVSDVNQMILHHYGEIRDFRNIMVYGEVTNFQKPNSGNYYFDIKDAGAMLPCIMWGSVAAEMAGFTLKAGMKVAVTGYLDYYTASGKTSLKVRQIRDAGKGEAALMLLRLKERLQAEGLFDEQYKKPIPKYPAAIGIVTSRDGQAIQDICKVAKMQNPYVQLVLFHVKVQGQYAVDTIVEGIQTLDRMGLDTIIVGRGGGSDEELMSYNDEKVVRAIFAAITPVISAVGHEGNWSLADYAADLRVPTPTAAAQAALPDIIGEQKRLEQIRQMLVHQMQNNLKIRRLMLDAGRNRLQGYDPGVQIQRRKDQLQYLHAEMGNRFSAVLQDRKRNLESLTKDLQRKMELSLEERRHLFEVLLTRLHGLSPTARLVQGFGYISLHDKPVTQIRQVKEGDPLQIRIHDGQILAEVKKVRPSEESTVK